MDASIRSRSLTISLIVHAALFLLLLYVVMNTTIPPFPESGGGGGVLVNIGNIDMATGQEQPMSSVVNKDPAPVKAQAAPPSQESKIATQDMEESVAIKESNKKNNKKNESKAVTPVVTAAKEEKKVVEKPRTAEEGSTYKGPTNKSKSQGSASTGTGDQGQKDGGPTGGYTGKQGTGGGPGSGTGTGGGDGDGTGLGKGNGFDFDLTGRKLLRQPSIDDRSQETGKVVVAITVDKNGNVTEARSGARGTTTTSSYLFAKAKEAAMTSKFNPDPNGNDIQKGTMTFVFLVH